MSDLIAITPLSDDELLFRRLPANPQYFDTSTRLVKDLAFRPREDDTDGLSLDRQSIGAEGAAAMGRLGKQFYVAVLHASDIVGRLGIVITADREDHALIPELTFAARTSKDKAVYGRVVELSAKLNSIVIRVEGPFPGRSSPPTAPPSRA